MRLSSTLLCVAASVILCATVAIPAAAEDFYQLLGVARDASDDVIKKAFKKLTREYHPDRQRGKPEAEKEAAKKHFMRIADAYEVISDPKKREQYDRSGGRGVVTAGDDRNYLKSHLFTDNFDGDEINAEEIEKALQGKLKTSLFVMFWSANFPECVDAGLAFKEVATRLKGSTVRVASYQCDNQPAMCRDLRIGNPPTAYMFVARTRSKWDRYNGKFEPQALTEFAVQYLRVGHRLTTPTSAAALLETCPDPMQSLPAASWASPYFYETSKRSYRGQLRAEFVAFQYSACYDCQTELSIALETLYPVMPSLLARTVNCRLNANKELCATYGPQRKNRAWTIVRFTRSCWYATKKPYNFSDDVCTAPEVATFDGKYASAEYVNFMLNGHKSHIVNLNTMKRVAKSNDSYAILYYNSNAGISANVKQHWEILARRVNTIKPVIGSKGHRVVIAQMDCAKPHAQCDAVQGRELPLVALYSFGLKAKKADPTYYPRIGSGAAMLKNILRDMEPLHLYQLTPQSYNTKVNGGITKGKRWFILYNAGQWCPPCNQIRSQWPKVARIVQNSPASKKLNVGVVDCEKFKQLCAQLNIDNYPTMTYIAPGRPKMDYNGNREAQAMADWAIDAIDNRLQSMGWQELQQALHSGSTLMVCFTAGQWCPPCTQLKPIFKKVANTFTSVAATQVDCDENQQLCMQFGIDGYPTIVMFHKGRQHPYEEGTKTVEAITRWAQKFV